MNSKVVWPVWIKDLTINKKGGRGEEKDSLRPLTKIIERTHIKKKKKHYD
jgi:hypothetical protein